jgi:hypothetical protein
LKSFERVLKSFERGVKICLFGYGWKEKTLRWRIGGLNLFLF